MRGAFFFLLFFIYALPAWAGSFEVAPTTISLSASGAGVFYISNHGAAPVNAQIEGYDWTQDENGDRLTPSPSVLFSPPMVSLQPGGQQTVRLVIKPDANATKERAFRLIISELPDAATKNKGIRMLLQFSVPVFMAGRDDDAPQLAWNAASTGSDLMLAAQNTGARHIKLSGLHLAEAGAAQEMAVAPNSFTYILPGASHRWNVPMAESPRGKTLHIKAYDEQEGATLSAPLPAIP